MENDSTSSAPCVPPAMTFARSAYRRKSAPFATRSRASSDVVDQVPEEFDYVTAYDQHIASFLS